MSSIWESIAEQRLAAAAADGVFDGLPGRGRPLHIEDETHVPAEWRMAFRLLSNADLSPAWIELGREIREAIEHLTALRRAVDADGGPSASGREGLARERQRLEALIRRYNLIVPGPRWQIAAPGARDEPA